LTDPIRWGWMGNVWERSKRSKCAPGYTGFRLLEKTAQGRSLAPRVKIRCEMCADWCLLVTIPKRNYCFGGVVSGTLPVLCKENAEPILRQRVRLLVSQRRCAAGRFMRTTRLWPPRSLLGPCRAGTLFFLRIRSRPTNR
jgi:hypothetical protein